VKTAKVLRELHGHFLADEGSQLRELWVPRREGETLERAVIDFLSGMTDHYALQIYQDLFLPVAWDR
jgi:dGTPase